MNPSEKSATLPAGGYKSQQKLSSHSFSGGFLGRLKRRFRLKSKGYEFQHSGSHNIQGVRIQWTPDRENAQPVGDRIGGRGTDLSRSTSERSAERPAGFLNPRYTPQKHKNGVPSAMCSQIGREIKQLNGGDIVRNDFLMSEDSVIDLEEDVGAIREEVFEETDPGYETLDEIRRKMQIRTTQETQENTSFCGADSIYYRPKVQQHRRSQSTGQPTTYSGEVAAMRDSGLGSPLVSDVSSSMRTSDMMRESMSIVSDTDISTLGFQHLSHSDYAEADFLSPTTNLGAMKMNSCPGNPNNHNCNMCSSDSRDIMGGFYGVYGSDTYLSQCQQTLVDEDGKELYANPQILLRKKREQDVNCSEVPTSVIRNSNDIIDDNFSQNRELPQISATGDRIVEEAEAPPIPERKYSLYVQQNSVDLDPSEGQGHKSNVSANESLNEKSAELEKTQETGEKLMSVYCDRGQSSNQNQQNAYPRIGQSSNAANQNSSNQNVDNRSVGVSVRLDEGDNELSQEACRLNPVNDMSETRSVTRNDKFNQERVILSGDVRFLPQRESCDTGCEEVEICQTDSLVTPVTQKCSDVCGNSSQEASAMCFTPSREGKCPIISGDKVTSSSNEQTCLKSTDGKNLSNKQEIQESQSLSETEDHEDISVRPHDSSTECDSSATDSTLKGLSGYSSDLSPLENLADTSELSPFENLGDSSELSPLDNMVDTNEFSPLESFSNCTSGSLDGNPSDATSESTPNIELSPLDNNASELSSQGAVGTSDFSPVELVKDDVELSPFGSTEGSAGGSSDRLSEPLSNIQVMSYEDDADAVLESMYSRSDSFADECDSTSSPGSNKNKDIEGTPSKSCVQLSTKIDSPAPETVQDPKLTPAPETVQDPKLTPAPETVQDPKLTSAPETAQDPKLTPASRLPDYYYEDTEPVHMSLSELGMSDEKWPAPTEDGAKQSEEVKQSEEREPIHMSIDELEASRLGLSSTYSVVPRLTETNPRRLATRSLPPSGTCNVYERVDNDPGSGDSIELYEEGRDGRHWYCHIPEGQQTTRGRHSWSPVVQSDEDGLMHDQDFLRRLDSRPPAVLPKRCNEDIRIHQNFMESMRQLKDCGWYWGPLSWDEAEIKLSNKPDGSFLVRDSSDDRYILSLSFNMHGHVHHTRIEHHKGKFSFWSQPDSHGKSTIRDFIEQCVRNSRNGQFLYFIRPSGPGSPPMPVHLLHPVSRYRQMRSLQHMCRFRILQGLRRDHIDQLPIPTRIKDYLKDPQYYVEYIEDD